MNNPLQNLQNKINEFEYDEKNKPETLTPLKMKERILFYTSLYNWIKNTFDNSVIILQKGTILSRTFTNNNWNQINNVYQKYKTPEKKQQLKSFLYCNGSIISNIGVKMTDPCDTVTFLEVTRDLYLLNLTPFIAYIANHQILKRGDGFFKNALSEQIQAKICKQLGLDGFLNTDDVEDIIPYDSNRDRVYEIGRDGFPCVTTALVRRIRFDLRGRNKFYEHQNQNFSYQYGTVIRCLEYALINKPDNVCVKCISILDVLNKLPCITKGDKQQIDLIFRRNFQRVTDREVSRDLIQLGINTYYFYKLKSYNDMRIDLFDLLAKNISVSFFKNWETTTTPIYTNNSLRNVSVNGFELIRVPDYAPKNFLSNIELTREFQEKSIQYRNELEKILDPNNIQEKFYDENNFFLKPNMKDIMTKLFYDQNNSCNYDDDSKHNKYLKDILYYFNHNIFLFIRQDTRFHNILKNQILVKNVSHSHSRDINNIIHRLFNEYVNDRILFMYDEKKIDNYLDRLSGKIKKSIKDTLYKRCQHFFEFISYDLLQLQNYKTPFQIDILSEKDKKEYKKTMKYICKFLLSTTNNSMITINDKDFYDICSLFFKCYLKGGKAIRLLFNELEPTVDINKLIGKCSDYDFNIIINPTISHNIRLELKKLLQEIVVKSLIKTIFDKNFDYKRLFYYSNILDNKNYKVTLDPNPYPFIFDDVDGRIEPDCQGIYGKRFEFTTQEDENNFKRYVSSVYKMGMSGLDFKNIPLKITSKNMFWYSTLNTGTKFTLIRLMLNLRISSIFDKENNKRILHNFPGLVELIDVSIVDNLYENIKKWASLKVEDNLIYIKKPDTTNIVIFLNGIKEMISDLRYTLNDNQKNKSKKTKKRLNRLEALYNISYYKDRQEVYPFLNFFKFGFIADINDSYIKKLYHNLEYRKHLNYIRYFKDEQPRLGLDNKSLDFYNKNHKLFFILATAAFSDCVSTIGYIEPSNFSGFFTIQNYLNLTNKFLHHVGSSNLTRDNLINFLYNNKTNAREKFLFSIIYYIFKIYKIQQIYDVLYNYYLNNAKYDMAHHYEKVPDIVSHINSIYPNFTTQDLIMQLTNQIKHNNVLGVSIFMIIGNIIITCFKHIDNNNTDIKANFHKHLYFSYILDLIRKNKHNKITDDNFDDYLLLYFDNLNMYKKNDFIWFFFDIDNLTELKQRYKKIAKDTFSQEKHIAYNFTKSLFSRDRDNLKETINSEHDFIYLSKIQESKWKPNETKKNAIEERLKAIMQYYDQKIYYIEWSIHDDITKNIIECFLYVISKESLQILVTIKIIFVKEDNEQKDTDIINKFINKNYNLKYGFENLDFRFSSNSNTSKKYIVKDNKIIKKNSGIMVAFKKNNNIYHINELSPDKLRKILK